MENQLNSSAGSRLREGGRPFALRPVLTLAAVLLCALLLVAVCASPLRASVAPPEPPGGEIPVDPAATQPTQEPEPVEEPEPDDADFVSVRRHISDIQVDLKYATEDNFTGQVIYDFSCAALRYGTVKKLAVAQELLREQGYSLLIWDAFRPVSAQYLLWEAFPDGNYIANPNRGFSNHSRGNCVDVTLVTPDGRAVAMPTGFDDFTQAAARSYDDLPQEVARHARLLEETMVQAGFIPYNAEWWHYTDEDAYPAEEHFTPAAFEQRIVTLNVSAIGDCVVATGYGYGYENSLIRYFDRSGGDYSYFFKNVAHLFEQDDLTVANGENVFTDSEQRMDKGAQGDRAFWFAAPAHYAKVYPAGGVDAVNIANNHSFDYGELGYADTIKALEAAGVTPFGTDMPAFLDIKGLRVALLAFNALGRLEEGQNLGLMKSRVREQVALARQQADVVIASFHWGVEYAEQPNEIQTTLGRLAVDCGAHLVVGHHPHILQPMEEYSGRLIAYSLGNFVYGGSVKPPKETAILQTAFQVDLNSRAVVATEHTVIECETYGDTPLNNYQPVLGRPTTGGAEAGQ